jgi:hypothetical protein
LFCKVFIALQGLAARATDDNQVIQSDIKR